MADRDAKGRFVKGHAAAPNGGRPKTDAEFVKACRDRSAAFPDWAMQQLERDDLDDNAKIKIWDLLIKYGHGSPRQMIDVNAAVDNTIRVSLIDD